MRTLEVAVAQLDLRPFAVERNLSRAEALVAEAAASGARLVALPEFLNVGFKATPEIWAHAEPADGPTRVWARRVVEAHGIFLAFTYAERSGADVYNNAVVAGPDGFEVSRRKNKPPFVEAFFYRATDDDPVLDTPLGSLGTTLCADTFVHKTFGRLAGRADLVVMMSSAPATSGIGRRLTNADEWRALPRLYAEHLRLPVLLADRTGHGEIDLPLPGGPTLRATFTEASCIVDPSTGLDVSVGSGEGIAVGRIAIPDPRPLVKPLPDRRGFVMERSWLFRTLYDRLTRRGARSYERARRRR